MNKWEVMGHSFEDIGMLLLTECENMATNCSVDPGFEQMYEHYEIMLRTLTNQHRLIQDAFNMLDAGFSEKEKATHGDREICPECDGSGYIAGGWGRGEPCGCDGGYL